MPNLVADANGVITGTFLVPANIPVGARNVHAAGNGQSFADAVYVGQSIVQADTVRQVTGIWYDPLAQTFQLDTPRFITGLDFVVCGIGSSAAKNPINVEIREVDNGVPTRTVLGKGSVSYDDIYIRPTRGTGPGLLSQAGWNLSAYSNNQTFSYGSTTAYGWNTVVRVYNSLIYDGPGRAFLKFNLPDVVGATILSAKLSVRKNNHWGDPTFPIVASKAGPTPWTNASHAWNNWLLPSDMLVPASNDPSIACSSANGGWFDFDVKSIIQEWADGGLNNGFCLHAATEFFGTAPAGSGVVEFNNDNDTTRPRLFVEWVRNPVSAAPVDGRFTRCMFEKPIYLEGGRSYAMVLMTDDPKHAVGIATLGQTVGSGDGTFGYITSQPMPTGVLLSSSNAESWTVHQSSDLCFRLLGAKFTSNSRDIDLGNFSPAQISDLVINATAFQPVGETTIRFRVTRISTGDVFYINDNEPLNFNFRAINETWNVTAELRGTETVSPILFANTLLISGNLGTSGDYVSRAIDASESFNLSVNLRAFLPGSSTLQVQAKVQRVISGIDQSAPDGTALFDWVDVVADPAFVPKIQGDGSYEMVFKRTGLRGVGNERTTAVRLVLTGTPANRPIAFDLAVFTKLP